MPNGISKITILRPAFRRTPTSALQTAIQTDRTALQIAIEDLLDPSSPALGYANGPSLTAAQQNFCNVPFDIDVPLHFGGTARSH